MRIGPTGATVLPWQLIVGLESEKLKQDIHEAMNGDNDKIRAFMKGPIWDFYSYLDRQAIMLEKQANEMRKRNSASGAAPGDDPFG